MLEDKLLLWKFKHGNPDALQAIYQKYKNDLLALAVSLTSDRATAEDVVHDVFVSFVKLSDKLQLRTNLKGYLLSSVANRVRNINKSKSKGFDPLENRAVPSQNSDEPESFAISTEQKNYIQQAMAKLPYDQREVILLHLQGEMTFRAIAESQRVSLNTVQSRYRYGLDKLRSMLDGKV